MFLIGHLVSASSSILLTLCAIYVNRQIAARRRFALLSKGPSAGVVVRHKVRQLYISRTFRPRMTKFYKNLNSGRVYNRTQYNVTNYFGSYCGKMSIMLPKMASGIISPKRLSKRSQNFKRLSGTTGPTNLPDMASLVTSGRPQNAIKYGTNVMPTMGPAGQRVK